MRMRLWDRYVVRELLRSFFFFLLCITLFFVMIDYACHKRTFCISDWLIFYGNESLIRLELFVPMAFLLATLKVLFQFNAHRELLAMWAGGVSLRRVSWGFLAFGCLLLAFLYVHEEWVLPKAYKRKMQYVERGLVKQKKRGLKPLYLQDRSLLVYESYCPLKKHFSNVYWIRSADDILHMGALHVGPSVPLGQNVRFIARKKGQGLEEKRFLKEVLLTNFKWHHSFFVESLRLPEEFSLSVLWKELKRKVGGERDALFLSAWYRKLIFPWLPLLSIMGLLPWSLRFSREFPFFAVATVSILSFVVCFLFLDALFAASKRQVLHPIFIFGGAIVLFLLFLWRFLRMRN